MAKHWLMKPKSKVSLDSDAMPNLLCCAMPCEAYIALTVFYTVLEC